MKALDKIRQAASILKASQIEQAFREAELIVSHCLGIDKVVLYRDDPLIPGEILPRIDRMLQRRKKREPLQYILSVVDFPHPDGPINTHISPSSTSRLKPSTAVFSPYFFVTLSSLIISRLQAFRCQNIYQPLHAHIRNQRQSDDRQYTQKN